MYYTLKEAMKIMKISKSKIEKLIKDGKLETYRIGRQHRITQEQIDNCVRGN